jgi:hypothetical protein
MAKKLVLFLLLASWACLAQQNDVVPTPRNHAPMIPHERHGKNVSSTNWSGYAVTGANGSVSDVKASWVVPQIAACTQANQYSSFWVGIDGYSSNTVEQIGTDSDCQNGKPVYYAWFEFYPHPSTLIKSVPIAPGHVISAEVKYDANEEFTVSLTDVTTGATFSGSSKVAKAQRSSAEWVAEAPYSGGILPLADFGISHFGQDYTSVQSTSYATVGGGKAAPIGSFSTWVSMTMVGTKNTSLTKAVPSSLSSDGSSFTIAWENAGP